MSIIKSGKKITVSYKVWDTEGNLMEETPEGGELVYVHGRGQIIQGLEKALEGKQVGESIEVIVKPTDGYGMRDENRVLKFPKSDFPEDVEEDMIMRLSRSDGVEAVVWVTKVEDETVTVDGNHPMAGQTLKYRIEVLKVEDN